MADLEEPDLSPNGDEGRMEGWLYLISWNRFGMKNVRKRYFVLDDFSLKSFKSVPESDNAEPVGSAIINSCIQVTDDGKKNISKRPLFFFTLYNISNQDEQLKLGASTPEEAERWIQSLKELISKEKPQSREDLIVHSSGRWQSIRTGRSRRSLSGSSADWIQPYSAQLDNITDDVSAPSPWKIVGVMNGLRVFKEAKGVANQQHWNGVPALMTVGVVDGPPEAIFHTLMSLGSSRSQWDFCFHKGSVIEQLDSQTDIIHEQLDRDWLPWGMQRRDLLLRRYWRKDDDGTYVILYHSVIHKKCPPQGNYIRASLKSGGFIITPVNLRRQSVVRYMLAVDWKSWRSQFMFSSTKAITLHVLERVAGLRELFKAKTGSADELSCGDLFRDNISLSESEIMDVQNSVASIDVQVTEQSALMKDEAQRVFANASLMDLDDPPDEFFDVPEPTALDHDLNHNWSLESDTLESTTGSLFPDLAGDKKEEGTEECSVEEATSSYGSTLPKDPTHTLPCTWAISDPSQFLIRGERYLIDHQKQNDSSPKVGILHSFGSLVRISRATTSLSPVTGVKTNETVMELVGIDWLRSDKREDDLAGRPGGLVQKYADQDGSEFFLVINMQVPGTTTYGLALYYMINNLEENKLLKKFVDEDDGFRNSKFKLIPYVSKGSWIVKNSVGKKACLVGQALDITYHRGKNYLELDVDIGSSSVAKGVVSLVLGYVTNLVIEMAFVIQADTQDELPECLLGTCRLNHLDVTKSVKFASK